MNPKSLLSIQVFSIWLLVLLTFGCAAYKIGNSKSAESGEGFETVADDGAWCWFSDPRAIYHKGMYEKIYFGHINRQGDVIISSRDVVSARIQHFVLHDTLEVDDHNVPTILLLPSGHLLVFYNEHNGNVFMRKSVNPENITSWMPEQVICRATDEFNYCYTNPVRLNEENGRIYIIGRKVGPTRSFDHWLHYMKHTDDEGLTWSEESILLDNQGRENPPYMKVATDHRERIDFLFTDGHPKIGSDVSIYHMYYAKSSFYQTNGERIGSQERLPLQFTNIDKVYDAVPSNIRSWIWDIALKEGSPVITYARFPSEHDHIYHYAYWEDDQWVDHEIVNSGSWMPSLRQGDRVREAHYSGGIVLDHQEPSRIYLSRNVMGKFEIEQRILRDGRWSSNFLTGSSSFNNVRPYVVYRSPAEGTILLWMNGHYRHYTEYDMAVKMHIIK